jgi:hypothetical protein
VENYARASSTEPLSGSNGPPAPLHRMDSTSRTRDPGLPELDWPLVSLGHRPATGLSQPRICHTATVSEHFTSRPERRLSGQRSRPHRLGRHHDKRLIDTDHITAHGTPHARHPTEVSRHAPRSASVFFRFSPTGLSIGCRVGRRPAIRWCESRLAQRRVQIVELLSRPHP